jgi:hypothetical protein
VLDLFPPEKLANLISLVTGTNHGIPFGDTNERLTFKALQSYLKVIPNVPWAILARSIWDIVQWPAVQEGNLDSYTELSSLVSAVISSHDIVGTSDTLKSIVKTISSAKGLVGVLSSVLPRISKSQADEKLMLTALRDLVESDHPRYAKALLSSLLEVWAAPDQERRWKWCGAALNEFFQSSLCDIFETMVSKGFFDWKSASEYGLYIKTLALLGDSNNDRQGMYDGLALTASEKHFEPSHIDLFLALLQTARSNCSDRSQYVEGWLESLFDHLTRRFSEDVILSPKVLELCESLGTYFKVNGSFFVC